MSILLFSCGKKADPEYKAYKSLNYLYKIGFNEV